MSTVHFSWTFNDPDAGDTQSAYEIQYQRNGGSWTTTNKVVSTANAADISALTSGSYNWNVRTWDTSNPSPGPWSSTGSFVINVAPNAPTGVTITSALVAGNPATLNWTHSDPEGDAQVKSKVRHRSSSSSGVVATGGTVTDIGGYRIHTFTSNDTFTVSNGGDLEYLVVAGGGAGGGGTAGGGGAGGLLTNLGTPASKIAGSYPVVVGAGGLSSGAVMSQGSSGADSTALGLTTVGGGAGANTNSGGGKNDGTNGGSGGGAATYNGLTGAPGLGTNGQGNNGGSAFVGGDSGGGSGGGGAGGPGASGSRNGGPGLSNAISGTATYYAGGGGGGGNADAGTGGLGGGGTGSSGAATAGTANTGSGGGGGWTYANGVGGSGGSGIVIIRYPISGGGGVPPWVEESEVNSAANSYALSTTGYSAGNYEAQVMTADSYGFGSYSDSANFSVVVQQAANISAVPADITLDIFVPAVGAGKTIYSVAGPVMTADVFAPAYSQAVGIYPTPPDVTLNIQAPWPSGAATVHAEDFQIQYAEIYLDTGGAPTIYWNGLFAVPPDPIILDMVEPTRSVYIMPTRAEYTDLQYKERFFDPQVNVTRRVEILQKDGQTLWDDKYSNKSRLITGNVSVDYTRDERRSLDLELANFDNGLVHKPEGFWYDKVLRIYRGIEFYDNSGLRSYEVPVGNFLMDRVTEARFPKTVKITARDYTKKCLLSKFSGATSFPAGSSITAVIASLAANADIHDRILPNTDEVLGTDVLFERGASRWEAMKQITDSFSYELFFDAPGYLVMRKYLDPTLSPISHEFLTGPKVGNLVDWEKSTDDSRIYNHISVIGSDTDSIPVWADSLNENPNSPTSIPNLGDRVLSLEPALVSTFEQAQELADAMLAINGLEPYEISMTALVIPWMEAGEIIRFTDPDADINEPDRFLLTSFNVPLGLEAMNATGNRVVIVS